MKRDRIKAIEVKPGHVFDCPPSAMSRSRYPNFKDSMTQRVCFSDELAGDMDTLCDGTTSEAVLDMLIQRVEWLEKKLGLREYGNVIARLKEARMWLEEVIIDKKEDLR